MNKEYANNISTFNVVPSLVSFMYTRTTTVRPRHKPAQNQRAFAHRRATEIIKQA